jgi:hypothetical protein
VAFIDANKDDVVGGRRLGVEPICRVLQVASSSYYAARGRAPSARAQRDAQLVPRLVKLWEDNYEVYGSRKLWKAATRAGIDIGRDQTRRLMRKAAIQGARRSKRVRTTRRDQSAGRHPDLVERRFTATEPNRLWVADLTFVPTWAGVAYVCFITDAFSRMIVGWRVAGRMRTPMVLDAIEMARWNRGTHHADLRCHSDAGSQGGFTRSSQHLDVRSWDGTAGWVDEGVDGALGDEVSRASVASAGGRAVVLAPDRQGPQQRGRRRGGRGLASGWQPMVSGAWRDGHAAARPRDVSVSVLCRA